MVLLEKHICDDAFERITPLEFDAPRACQERCRAPLATAVKTQRPKNLADRKKSHLGFSELSVHVQRLLKPLQVQGGEGVWGNKSN